MDLLVERMVGRRLLQLGYQLPVFPGGQPRVGQRVPDLLAEQFQPPRLLFQPGQPGQVGQRPPAPQGQRLPQVRGRAGRVRGLRALAEQPLGQQHVGAVVAEVQQVTGRPGHDGGLAEHGTQVRDVALQRVQRGGRGLAPDRVDQAAGSDDLAGVQGQGGQDGLPPQPADRQHLAAVHDIDRSQ